MDEHPKKTAVVMGGPSLEHDVSVKTGTQVVNAVDRSKYRPLPVLVRKDSLWLVADEAGSAVFSPEEHFDTDIRPLAAHEALSVLQRRGFTTVFIAVHGTFGEDGTLQGLLSSCGFLYTGSGPRSSALCIDKVNTKAVLSYHDLPVAPDRLLYRHPTREEFKELLALVGLPCVVKRPALGSSFGVTLAQSEKQLRDSIDEYLEHGRVMVEAFIEGIELTCGVLQALPGEDSNLILPVTEIVPGNSEFFDFEAKYTPGATDEITPARLSDAETVLIQKLAGRTFDILGCRGLARVDFMMTREKEPVILEINTIPGMTETSILPQQALAAGISFPELLGRIIDSATAPGLL